MTTPATPATPAKTPPAATPPGAMILTEEAPGTLKEMLGRVNIKKRFEEILGDKDNAAAFVSSIISATQTNPSLAKSTPVSIISSAAISASLNLPINNSLGQAALVPYKNKDGVFEAQFQIMWKGIIQLALRSGQYKAINLAPVYEGQLVSYDEFKGKVALNAGAKKSDKVVGFYFYFSLLNGFEKEVYWSVRKCIAHGLRHSASFKSGQGKWTEDPNLKACLNAKGIYELDKFNGLLDEDSGTFSMSAKTVIKNTLTKYGILSVAMQKAVTFDQAVVTADGRPKYIDGTTGEVTEAPPAAPWQNPDSTSGAAAANGGAGSLEPSIVDIVADGYTVSKVKADWHLTRKQDGAIFVTNIEEFGDLLKKKEKAKSAVRLEVVAGMGQFEILQVLSTESSKN